MWVRYLERAVVTREIWHLLVRPPKTFIVSFFFFFKYCFKHLSWYSLRFGYLIELILIQDLSSFFTFFPLNYTLKYHLEDRKTNISFHQRARGRLKSLIFFFFNLILIVNLSYTYCVSSCLILISFYACFDFKLG